ncbi:hypothetical protein FLHKCMKP_CDS0024 [Escherichia phage KS_A3]
MPPFLFLEYTKESTVWVYAKSIENRRCKSIPLNMLFTMIQM